MTGKGGVFRSIHGVGAVMTNMVLGTGLPNAGRTPNPANKTNRLDPGNKEDERVMETKLKIIQILQVKSGTVKSAERLAGMPVFRE